MTAGLAAGGFPVGDWQFWLVTGIVAGALGLVAFRIVRARRRRRQGRTRPVRATLTVDGTAVGRR